MRVFLCLVLCLALIACGNRDRGVFGLFKRDRADEVRIEEPVAEVDVEVETEAPPEDATTVEEFDTTSLEEREDAVDTSDLGEEIELGRTVASLGDPTSPGFWLQTPLVAEERQGRVVEPESGASVQVLLIPSGEAEGSGSQISLAALRLLGVPLTSLPELQVYADPI